MPILLYGDNMKQILGKIIKPQGVKGELKVYPNDTNMSIYKNIKKVEIDSQEIELTSFAVRGQFIYIKLPTCSDRTMAEKYRNKTVFVESSDLNLGENTYFTNDLIESEVFDESGEYVGILTDVESYGSADVLTILEDKREYKIPFLTSIVTKVESGKIIVNKQKYDEVKICE